MFDEWEVDLVVVLGVEGELALDYLLDALVLL
jgi:hypothetical protein